MFRLSICSDLDYEEMVADIIFNDEVVGTVTQEEGLDKMKIEIFPHSNLSSWNFSLDDFINILNFAKKQLTLMQKLD